MRDTKVNITSYFPSIEISYKISVNFSILDKLYLWSLLTVGIVTCTSLSEVSHEYSSSCLNIKSQMGRKIIYDEHTDCILIVKDDVRMATCMKRTLL